MLDLNINTAAVPVMNDNNGAIALTKNPLTSQNTLTVGQILYKRRSKNLWLQKSAPKKTLPTISQNLCRQLRSNTFAINQISQNGVFGSVAYFVIVWRFYVLGLGGIGRI
jgi:hypothetical protein